MKAGVDFPEPPLGSPFQQCPVWKLHDLYSGQVDLRPGWLLGFSFGALSANPVRSTELNHQPAQLRKHEAAINTRSAGLGLSSGPRAPRPLVGGLLPAGAETAAGYHRLQCGHQGQGAAPGVVGQGQGARSC